MDSLFEQVVSYLSKQIPECAIPLTSFLIQMKNRYQEEKEEIEEELGSKIQESVNNGKIMDAYEQIAYLQKLNERIISIEVQINNLVNELAISVEKEKAKNSEKQENSGTVVSEEIDSVIDGEKEVISTESYQGICFSGKIEDVTSTKVERFYISFFDNISIPAWLDMKKRILFIVKELFISHCNELCKSSQKLDLICLQDRTKDCSINISLWKNGNKL